MPFGGCRQLVEFSANATRGTFAEIPRQVQNHVCSLRRRGIPAPGEKGELASEDGPDSGWGLPAGP
jgi:hypothetical protein